MPNSLKCRLKSLVHKGLLSEKDLSRIYTDNDVIMGFEKIKAEIQEESYSIINVDGDFYDLGDRIVDLDEVNGIINERIYELKGEKIEENNDKRTFDDNRT